MTNSSAFFLPDGLKKVKLWPILGDDLECVFSIFDKKKRTPIRHPKSQKVRFFIDFVKILFVKKKKIHVKVYVGNWATYFSDFRKKRTFWDFK